MKHERESWLLPSYSELLADADYFSDRITQAHDKNETAKLARAAVIFSAAGIEALSNDALTVIEDLYSDSWPWESIQKPPYCYFRQLSERRVQRLLQRGSLQDKVEYLLNRIERDVGCYRSNNFDHRLRTLLKIRNRILHFQSLGQTRKTPSILNAKQIAQTAQLAINTAYEFQAQIEQGFEKLNLPIQLYRPGPSKKY